MYVCMYVCMRVMCVCVFVCVCVCVCVYVRVSLCKAPRTRVSGDMEREGKSAAVDISLFPLSKP